MRYYACDCTSNYCDMYGDFYTVNLCNMYAQSARPKIPRYNGENKNPVVGKVVWKIIGE